MYFLSSKMLKYSALVAFVAAVTNSILRKATICRPFRASRKQGFDRSLVLAVAFLDEK